MVELVQFVRMYEKLLCKLSNFGLLQDTSKLTGLTAT
jgi:hypothetical protein